MESERDQIQEMLRVLDAAPRLLSNSPPLLESVKQPTKSTGRTLQNRNVTGLVREYIDNFAEYDTKIEVGPLVREWLQAQNGVKGKYRSLYSAVHVILKKETQPKGDRPPRLVLRERCRVFEA
jgi:hypothetical protein